MNRDELKKRTKEFALRIIKLVNALPNNSAGRVIGNQLLRSGTSIGANVSEALAGQSRKDFISKMSIASKEARETRYWLELLQESRLIDYNFTDHLKRCEEIVRIITAIVKTAQKNDK